MIAPLDVHIVAAHEGVHDDIRPGTAVENIAHDVQVIAGQRLDERTERLDDLGRLADVNDGVQDAFVLPLAEALLIPEVDQLIQDVAVSGGHV